MQTLQRRGEMSMTSAKFKKCQVTTQCWDGKLKIRRPNGQVKLDSSNHWVGAFKLKQFLGLAPTGWLRPVSFLRHIDQSIASVGPLRAMLHVGLSESYVGATIQGCPIWRWTLTCFGVCIVIDILPKKASTNDPLSAIDQKGGGESFTIPFMDACIWVKTYIQYPGSSSAFLR